MHAPDMAHFDEQASNLLRARADELYEWLGPHASASGHQIIGGWLSLSPADRETVTDVLIATWAKGLCTGHFQFDAVAYDSFQRGFVPGHWEEHYGFQGQVTPFDTATIVGMYRNYIVSRVHTAVDEYTRHHRRKRADEWAHELLGPGGLTVVKLTRLGEKATDFIRWRVVHVEEEVRRDSRDLERLDELMWPADKFMRLATVYAQSAEHRFAIYRHLLESLQLLYAKENTLNSAHVDLKVTDARRVAQAIAEWTSDAAFHAFQAEEPEHQAHTVSHARFMILNACRKFHISGETLDVDELIRGMKDVTFDDLEWPDFETTSNEKAEPRRPAYSLAHGPQISDYYAQRHYGTTAAAWSRRQL
ncbi:uncharacterized protein RHOBADRAFT_54626 [Rhodotorula graminis WP1]|uniref:Uncharacterized protein n=1 Tax=Rhodotorula graminis (strain WP1) TaxID=578459 RepID=A0A0P9H222_RHOGW|nr:uncharacterized protein RHOBADRAFT_54626 [Rhodotorula graminis WP1]KPV74065.1 hypothetical protein RHOBADRAFT_54626 [Rhodotorula graminis WP1]